jgi:hypothetical protein
MTGDGLETVAIQVKPDYKDLKIFVYFKGK